MGAWGIGSFENDDAADFIVEFEDGGVVTAAEAIRTVTEYEAEDYLEIMEAGVALAAAELVLAALSGDASRLTDEARAALAPHVSALARADLRGDAVQAVVRILADSELRELWEETDECDAWLANVEALLERLNAL
ncbi:MAG: DUF4259 domain-containing protein [Hyphomicrobiaceae bacterium]